MKKLVNGILLDMTPEDVLSMQQSIQTLAEIKLSEVATWRDDQEKGTVEYLGHVWQGDSSSRDRINTTLSAFSQLRTLPGGFFWTSLSNEDVPITFDQLEGLLQAIVNKGFAIHARQRAMKTEIGQLLSNNDYVGLNNYVIDWTI